MQLERRHIIKFADDSVVVSLLNSEDLDHGPVLNFPVAQMVEHGASNANIMGSIPRESKSWSNVKL